MLEVRFAHRSNPAGDIGYRTASWTVSELEFPRLVSYEWLATITADGEELAYIKEWFTNIRFSTASKSITWAGDDAVFIYNTLGQSRITRSRY